MPPLISAHVSATGPACPVCDSTDREFVIDGHDHLYGNAIEEFGRRGWQAVGVEPNPRAVETGRRRGLDLLQVTLDDVRFPDSAFDYVRPIQSAVCRLIGQWAAVLVAAFGTGDVLEVTSVRPEEGVP